MKILKVLWGLSLLTLLLLCSCKTESPVIPPETQTNYSRIFSVESGNIRFEIWSATSLGLVSGYNKIGFKVFENNNPKTGGFVRFIPKMYHTYPGSPMHSAPVSSQFEYNSSEGLFTGYVSYLMVTDTYSIWYGFYNYNDALRIDSVVFTVATSSLSQTREFIDVAESKRYILTLASPLLPVLGVNTFQCLLHTTTDDKYYIEIDSAEMYIRTWMESMGHGSSNNTNPAYIGGGIYEGRANLTMSGIWFVYDSIKVQSRFITAAPPPRFIFDVP